MGTKTQNATARPSDATPADVLRARAIHTVTGYTSSVYKIRALGVGSILAAGHLPTHLVRLGLLDISHKQDAASVLRDLLDEVLDDEKRDEMLQEVTRLREYQAHLVSAALVDPALTVEEVLSGEFPEDDLSMIAEIVQRLRAFDARGVRIGVEPLDRWARFHQEHGLDAEGCEHCERLAREFSSVDVGAV